MDVLLPEKEYFTIGEASELTQVQPYVLRYWESEFHLLRPSRRESGHRKYSKKDIENIRRVKELLYEKKFTIPGAKKFLIQESRKKPEQVSMQLTDNGPAVQVLQEAKETIDEILQILKQ